MNWLDQLDLSQLPLSAFTPGKGDPRMEGGIKTASGAPMYTIEAYLRGEAPYVTGAISGTPAGQLVWRSVGDKVVPVRITDHGPDVQGIDIASENRKWGTNFPYQGQRDTRVLSGTGQPQGRPGGAMDSYRSMVAQTSAQGPLADEVENAFYGGGNAQPRATPTPRPTPTPSPAEERFISQPSTAPVAGASFTESGAPMFSEVPKSFFNAYASGGVSPAQSGVASAVGSAFSQLGQGISKQSQQGMQQALQMLQKKPGPLAQYLQSLMSPPTMTPINFDFDFA